jgi:hypothetical protein
LFIKRLGSAETGVSIRLLPLEFCGGCETGWGRAKGLGGPDAPAESRADADGDGGGRTTPEPEGCSEDCPFRCAFAAVVAEWGEESPVALPPSDGSSGICTFRTGRFPPPSEALFVREGGWNPSGAEDIEDMDTLRGLAWDCARPGGPGDCVWVGGRAVAPTSIECARLLEVAVPLRGVSALEVEEAQC